MLIKKTELRYRRSTIHGERTRMKRCKYCKSKTVMEIHAEDGAYLGHGLRCKVLGLENNRRYGIDDMYVCDAFEMRKK